MGGLDGEDWTRGLNERTDGEDWKGRTGREE